VRSRTHIATGPPSAARRVAGREKTRTSISIVSSGNRRATKASSPTSGWWGNVP
jgi:hypothetical protein